MRARFVPDGFNEGNIAIPPGNIQISPATMTTGPNPPPWIGQRERCARWVEATDFNYPPPPGEITWEVQGVSPEGRTVILTNKRHAHLVYTALMLYPSVWDSMFREAMVAYLASQVALALWEKDRKFGLEIRNQQIAITKEKLIVARMNDGNEGVYSSDIPVDWLSFRRTGGYGRGEFGNGHGDVGMLSQGYASVGFLDGTSF